MRNLTRGFTMRRDGVLPRGAWYNIVNQGDVPKVYIYDEIGFWGTTAQDFVDALNEIDALKFELHINSPGGEIFDGLAIFNTIKQHPATVTAYVDGLAASAASWIAQAADEVIMARNAQMMIHDGIGFAYGNAADMRDTANLLDKLSDTIADIYGKAALDRGIASSAQEFRALMREEVWYTGKEAVDAGLADTVLDQDNEEADAAANKWDLSFYNHAGRDHAESPLRLLEKVRLENRTENSMSRGTPKNNTPEGTPEGTEPEVPDTASPDVDTDAEPTPAPEAPAAPAVPEPPAANTAAPQGVFINGQWVTDFAAIQAHMNTLTAAQVEQQTVFRKNFVEGLATANKIPATQVDSLIELVNGSEKMPAMSDEQFAAFQASYESAPASSLFVSHGSTPQANQSGGPVDPSNNEADRIKVLEGTVAMHLRSMPLDQVEQTASYKELERLRSQSN